VDQNQRLGELLVKSGQISQNQLEKAQEKLKTEPGSLLTVLVDMGLLSFSTLSRFVEKALGMKTFAIGSRRVDQKLLDLVTWERIDKNWIFPVGLKKTEDDEFLVVGMVDPLATSAVLGLESRLKYRIYPVLISKPDYLNAKAAHRVGDDRTSLNIDFSAQPSKENLVIIRPGGYEEEIAFESRRQKTQARQTGIELTSVTSESSQSAVQSNYVGESTRRFREEVLAKLDIDPKEAGVLRQEQYSRELLAKELAEISSKTLSEAFEKLPAELKIEAVVNALIEKGFLSKRDLYIQAATSHVFSTKTDITRG